MDVTECLSRFETRSLSTLTHVLPPIRPVGFPIYVPRRPAAPFTRCYPRRFMLITRTAPARASYLAALPATRADARSRTCSMSLIPSAPFTRYGGSLPGQAEGNLGPLKF